ncbi:SRPBCC family protein [Oceanomicrobium pacificus]|uniref:SRPBCC family protein n=1 Tax=Oceanomicrobium pacificus TaxID=2692916 RepID=A0A6B0TPR9_9RHOB|nr:SRPBCC family protein [Oceanomicrobium pacificus]MXU63848.1 SRPBCC family protein [Oceanomicrobium pacificus]
MNYSCDCTINRPRDTVIALFDSTENLPKWQDGLVSFDHVSGSPGQEGAVSRLRYQMGKREIEMVETITERALPDRFAATYEADGVWNIVENRFEALGDRTRWQIDTEFRCKGMMRIMAFLMPGAFRKQTEKMMQSFKSFAESQ